MHWSRNSKHLWTVRLIIHRNQTNTTTLGNKRPRDAVYSKVFVCFNFSFPLLLLNSPSRACVSKDHSTHTWPYRSGSSCRRVGPASAGRCTAACCLRYNCVCDWREPAGTGSPEAWSSGEASCDLKTHRYKKRRHFNDFTSAWPLHLLSFLWFVFTVFSQSLYRCCALTELSAKTRGQLEPECLSPLRPTSPQTGSRALCFYTSLGSPQGNVNHC